MILIAANSNRLRKKLKDAALLLFLGTSLLTFTTTHSQTKTIKFDNSTWEEIKARSAKENKLIFLDAYASWCGICKKMNKNVFSDDSVADYYNANFINARIDMESGEGPGIAKQYNVNVYPTLLFLDGQGNTLHRSEGGMQPREFITLAKDARDPGKQNSVGKKTNEANGRSAVQSNSNRTQIGFNISQYHRDFGFGLHVISPYFFMKMVAIKAGSNIQWLEHFNGKETTWTAYQNIQLGMRGRSNSVTDNLSVYGEGGMFVVLPSSAFSSQSLVMGGYGLFGFEFRVSTRFVYFVELGGVGTGATADRIANKPIYSNGFLTNVGLNIGL